MSDNYSVQDLQDNLDYLNETKRQIKNAIINKGQTIGASDTFRSYADKIEAIQTSEDLDIELNTQDQIIEDIKTSLNNKGGGDLALNIYAQMDEPDIKKGIWLKTDKQVDNIIQDENVFVSEQWNTAKTNSIANIPYDFMGGVAVAISSTIYLLGGTLSKTNNYKYDTITNTYTKLANIPYNFYDGGAVVVGSNIYLFGGGTSSTDSGSNTLAYKYDTITNTYTKLANIPYSFYRGGCVALDNDNIYLVGSDGSSALTNVYKYNISTNTYIKMNNISYYSDAYNSTVKVDRYIYSLGGQNGTDGNRRYDTITGSTSLRASIPYTFWLGGAVAFNNNIYLFGANKNNNNSLPLYFYKYNISNNSYTKLTNCIFRFSRGAACIADDATGKHLFMFGR